MNTDLLQQTGKDAQCCVEFCEATFTVSDRTIVNAYKCNQRQFSASDMWRIQKNKKGIDRGSALL